MNGNCAPDSLRFLRESGMPVGRTPSSAKGFSLLLTGTADGDEEVLTAALSSKTLLKDSTTRQTLTEAGALGLASYSPLTRDVLVVPVNGAPVGMTEADIRSTLDKIYAPALVNWTVTLQPSLTVTGTTADGFKTTGLSLASRYTNDMNRVIDAFKDQRGKDKETVVLFFVKADGADKQGYMPLTGDYGFIFNLGSNAELLAHELAHGAFNLKHTFSDDAYWREKGNAPTFPERSTQNLMDYAGGTELWKYQWDLIHDPETVLLGAMDEEEGASVPIGIYYWSLASGWTVSKYVPMAYNEETLNSLGYFTHVKINEIEKKKEESTLAIANAQRRLEQEIAAFEYQKSQNIFFIIYQISPFSAATQATINFSNGEYGWGTFNAALALLGGAELNSMLRASSKSITCSIDDVWRQADFNRNVLFRNLLTKTLYRSAGDIAEARIGLLPVVDVVESGTGVAFRAVDDFTIYENGLKKTIDDLAKAKQVGSVAGMSGEVKLGGVRLDIVVPYGKGTSLPENIGSYAKANSIGVRVFEVAEEAGEIVVKANHLPAIVRQLTVKPKYLPNRIIFSNPSKTVTVIGRWQGELEDVYYALSSQDLNIYSLSGKFEHKGGFNMLSLDDWNNIKGTLESQGIRDGSKAFDNFIWENYNKPWLESALQRGDDIVIWSDPNLPGNKEKFFQIDKIDGPTYFARELEFIKSNASRYGYDFNKGITTGIFSK